MTHTISVIDSYSDGARKVVIATVTISSYTASGEVITAGEFGLSQIDEVSGGMSAGGYLLSYNGAGKLVCFMGDFNNDTNGPMIVATTAGNLGAFRVRIQGRG
jgi:hypothetical protein